MIVSRSQPARKIIEQEFFGKEIKNVVAHDGVGRVERLETHDQWRERVTANGFRAVDLAVSSVNRDESSFDGLCRVLPDGEVLVLHWEDVPLIGSPVR